MKRASNGHYRSVFIVAPLRQSDETLLLLLLLLSKRIIRVFFEPSFDVSKPASGRKVRFLGKWNWKKSGHFFPARSEERERREDMFSSSARQPSRSLLASGKRLFPTRSDAVRSNSQKKKNFGVTTAASTSTSSNTVVVKSNKPSDAPKDPYKSLSNLQILSVTETDSSFVDVHSLFDPSCDKNVLILMRSFG